MSLLLWSLVLLPATAGGVLALCGGDRSGGTGDDTPTARRCMLPAAVALTAGTVTLGLAVGVAVLRPAARTAFLPAGPLALAVDGLSAVVVMTVAAVSLLVLVFAAGDVRHERPRFFGLMLLFVSAVLLTSTATTLPALLLAWEVMGATSYALIAFRWRNDASVTAGATAFLTTRAGDLGLYLAAGAALAAGPAAVPGLSLSSLHTLPGPWLHAAAAGVLLAALGKAAQLPFSFWLSRAMLGPAPVSALLHSAAMVAMGGYLLLRLRDLLEAAGWAATTAAWTGALTALLLGAVAVFLRDLKQLLAASTSAQLGLVVLAAGSGAVAGGTAHLAAHAAVKALLFLCAGAWLSTLGARRLPALRGAARRDRTAGTAFTVGALALAGLPPLSLWATKDEILAAVDDPALYGVTSAAAVLSALYAGKALGLLLRPPVTTPHRMRIDAPERVPLAVLAVGAAVLGMLALPPLDGWLKNVLGVPAEPSADLATALGSAALALAGTAVAVVCAPRVREPSWARSWLHLEDAVRVLIVRPVLRLAHVLARFDDAVLDRAVTATAPALRRLASRAAAVDDRGVDGAVRGIAHGARRLGELARRPQTGQLHQYYAQAMVLLALAVALLLLLR